MANVEFDYNGRKIDIQCYPDEKMDDIFKRFAEKEGKTKDHFYFTYGGTIVEEILPFQKVANKLDKERNKMTILVNLNYNNIQDDEFVALKKSKYIICPECKENARILIDNYQFGIYNCKNNHKINIQINDFEKTQNIDENKIKCENCNNINKSNSYKNIFYLCLNCNKNLCPICKQMHDKTHIIVDYEDRFFYCDLHNEQKVSYCQNCKKDLCMNCEKKHNGHKIIYYGSIIPEEEQIKEETNNFISKKEELKKEIKIIINKLNNLMLTLDKYFSIYQDIVYNYKNKKRNYFLLQNINDIIKYNNQIVKDITQIINEKNISNKINHIINIFHKMLKENKIEENKDKKDNIKENKIKFKKQNENNSQKIQIVKYNKELMKSYEKSKNYEDFNITKMNTIVTFNIRDINEEIFILKDGRLLIYGKDIKDKFIFIVYDLQTNNFINMNIDEIYGIIQMDDGIVIILTEKNKLLSVDIKEKDFQMLQELEIEFEGIKYIGKLSAKKIIIVESRGNVTIYKYENKKLTIEKELNSAKKFQYIEKMTVINEKEISLSYIQNTLFSSSYNIGFIDLEKDYKIQSYKTGDLIILCLINDDLFIYGEENKLYRIHLKNHSKKKNLYYQMIIGLNQLFL